MMIRLLILLTPFSMFVTAEEHSFQPVKISVMRRGQMENGLPEEPIDELDSHDPFDLNDSTDIFSDFANTTKRLKIQFETEKYIKTFGPQQLLNTIMKKIESGSLITPSSKESAEQFLDFVENLIYNNAAERIEKKLKLDFKTLKKMPSSTLHSGEIEKKPKTFSEQAEYRRDAPALPEYAPRQSNSILINVGDRPLPIARQPIEPAKLMFLSQHEPSFLRTESMVGAQREIRRSRGNGVRKSKHKISKAQLAKAIQKAEKEALALEKTPNPNTTAPKLEKFQPLRKLPIAKLDERNSRRSPIKGSNVTLNEKMFQLLEEYGVRSFRLQTADYTVRAYVDPLKTRFISGNVMELSNSNNNIRRNPVRKPAFIYSRMIKPSEKPSKTASKNYRKSQRKPSNQKRKLPESTVFDRLL